MEEDVRVNRQGPCGRREVLAGSGDKNKYCCSMRNCSRLLRYGDLLQYGKS
jgi:hypothetical protein